MSPGRYALSLVTLVTIAACGGSEQPGGDGKNAEEQALAESLRIAAERMADAIDEPDFDVQVELAHPKLVEQFGGAAGYRKILEQSYASAVSSGPPKGRITGVDRVVVRDGRAYAFVSYELEMTRRDGVRGVVDSYFVVESPADGSAWGFLDGSGMQGSLEMVRKMIPSWPEELPPPEMSGEFRKL